MRQLFCIREPKKDIQPLETRSGFKPADNVLVGRSFAGLSPRQFQLRSQTSMWCVCVCVCVRVRV
jgi:hypothetical protein